MFLLLPVKESRDSIDAENRLMNRELDRDRIMNDRWQLSVLEGDKLVYAAELTGPAEIGRQLSDAEKLLSHFRHEGRWRVVISPSKETTVSRKHLEVKPLTKGVASVLRQPKYRQSAG